MRILALAMLALLGACTDYTVTLPPEEEDLTTAEIRAQLKSGNFREKLAAKKQIGKLPPPERLRVLQALATDPDVPTRTIAVQELGELLPDPGARETLAGIAKDDPDESLRAIATEKLGAVR